MLYLFLCVKLIPSIFRHLPPKITVQIFSRVSIHLLGPNFFPMTCRQSGSTNSYSATNFEREMIFSQPLSVRLSIFRFLPMEISIHIFWSRFCTSPWVRFSPIAMTPHLLLSCPHQWRSPLLEFLHIFWGLTFLLWHVDNRGQWIRISQQILSGERFFLAARWRAFHFPILTAGDLHVHFVFDVCRISYGLTLFLCQTGNWDRRIRISE